MSHYIKAKVTNTNNDVLVKSEYNPLNKEWQPKLYYLITNNTLPPTETYIETKAIIFNRERNSDLIKHSQRDDEEDDGDDDVGDGDDGNELHLLGKGPSRHDVPKKKKGGKRKLTRRGKSVRRRKSARRGKSVRRR